MKARSAGCRQALERGIGFEGVVFHIERSDVLERKNDRTAMPDVRHYAKR